MTQQVLSQGIDVRTADERRAEALEILEAHLPDQVRTGAVLEARDVSKAFGGLQALTGVSLEVGAAQTTGLIGPNGAGKSPMLDEATAGLDAVEAHGLLSLVKRLQIDLGLAVLIIEHHVRSVMNMCDMIYVLDQGRLICSGPPSVVRVDPQVQSAYLGEERSL